MKLPVLVMLFAVMAGTICLESTAWSKQVSTPTAVKTRVAILDEDFPGADRDLAKSLQAKLAEQANAVIVSADELVKGLSSEPAGFDFVIFPAARYLPANVKEPLISFLKKGGDMIAIGGPAFSQVVTRTDGQWAGVDKDKNTQADPGSPILESLSPSYQTYPVKAAKLVPNKIYEGWGFSDEIQGPIDVVSPIWRPRGLGASQPHAARWIPILFAQDDKGERRGTAAALKINYSNDFPGSVWGYIGFSGESQRDIITSAAAKMLTRIKTGVFLTNAGMEKFSYNQGDKGQIGAYITWPGSLAKPMVRFRIISSYGPTAYDEKVVIRPNQRLSSTAPLMHRVRTWKTDYTGRFYARVDLFDGDKPIDTITHDFSVISPNSKPAEAVTAKDGDFYLGGKKWYPVGVNYWPVYIMGSNEGLDWLNPIKYDPEMVERDLALISNLGFNVVSVQYMRASETATLIDFLNRCRRYDLKAHIYIEGFHPLSNANHIKTLELIKAAKLAHNDAVFALDIAWEPIIGSEENRKRWDGEWKVWVVNRYGSLENAYKDWEYTPKSADGSLPGATDKELTEDGQWKVMVAAYRRFWDDLISQKYAYVVNLIKSVDNVHLIGARSGYGGTGSPHVAGKMPFDLASGAKHLDFICPESWNLAPDWTGVQAGGAITAYARLVSGGKPVYWAEFGNSIWPECSDQKLTAQSDFCTNIIRMMGESGANGGSIWWWPGGYRVGESTDFGLMNPDGTPRPAALAIKAAAAKLAASERRKPDQWIVIDRDEYVKGYAGVYVNTIDEYIKAANAGSFPALKTAGTGTDSSNVPEVAVGNKPLNGSNPPKFLNAEIYAFQLKNNKGRMCEWKSGQVMRVGKGKPVQVQLKVGNIGEAAWLAGGADATGTVTVTAVTSTGQTYRTPIQKTVPMFGDYDFGTISVVPAVTEQMTVTLQMEAVGKSMFGPKIQFTVAP